MIIIGYQGIGKSTLAGKNNKYIDLESSNFAINGERYCDWYKIYGNIAEHLSKQGYVVFTSSHEVVRNRFKESTEKVVVTFPSIDIKDEWINKLKARYVLSESDKDYRAYINAEQRYTENIEELMMECFDLGYFDCIVINDIEYDLETLINQALESQKSL